MNHKTETLGEKLESIDCLRDDKARRVSNVAPDTVAEITADELESGVSLERLDALNVPALRYSTQLTIHGKLPGFNSAARPGGYKAIFQNGNGSIGVRFSAIDAEKKAILRRVSRVAGAAWHAFANSTGFYLQRSFYVRDESERAAQRAATVDALKSFPVSLFYGSAGAYALPYGLGYAVEVNLGAIPAANLWEFSAAVFGVVSPGDLEAREAVEKAKQAEKDVQWRAECDARAKEREAANIAKVAGLVTLTVAPDSGQIFILTRGELLGVKLEKVKNRNFYTVQTRDGAPAYGATRKVFAAFPWPKSLAAGRVYAEQAPEIVPAPATVDAPAVTVDTPAPAATRPPLDSDKAAQPASKSQTWGLFCATGRDFRGLCELRGLTYGEVSAALAAAQPFRGNKPAALAAVSALIGQPISV